MPYSKPLFSSNMTFVATEMDCFTHQLRKNEKSNTKRIQLSLDKTERLNKSILELSEVSSSAMDDIRTQLINFQKNYSSSLLQSNSDVTSIKEEAERAESQWESSISGLQVKLTIIYLYLYMYVCMCIYK
jgi:septation ring formation regulator EzrA